MYTFFQIYISFFDQCSQKISILLKTHSIVKFTQDTLLNNLPGDRLCAFSQELTVHSSPSKHRS